MTTQSSDNPNAYKDLDIQNKVSHRQWFKKLMGRHDVLPCPFANVESGSIFVSTALKFYWAPLSYPKTLPDHLASLAFRGGQHRDSNDYERNRKDKAYYWQYDQADNKQKNGNQKKHKAYRST